MSKCSYHGATSRSQNERDGEPKSGIHCTYVDDPLVPSSNAVTTELGRLTGISEKGGGVGGGAELFTCPYPPKVQARPP